MPRPAGRVTLIVGDDAEWEESQGKVCMGNAACLEWDSMHGSLSVLSSIVAMPPIFVCRTPGVVVVTSELYLLRAVAQLPLAINPQSALELFAIGYPLGHRTLFTGVTLMRATFAMVIPAGDATEAGGRDRRPTHRIAREWSGSSFSS